MSKKEKDVVTYLQQNPDFFIANESLLSDLNFPHEEQTISIFHRQIELLREKNANNGVKLVELIDQAIANESQLQRFKQLLASLVIQDSLTSLQLAISDQVQNIFGLRLVELVLFAKVPKAKVSECQTMLDKKTKRKDVVCVRVSRKERELIIPQLSVIGQVLGVEHLQSSAILKLGNSGYCILGSSDDNHFNADLSTLFLELLADVLQALLARLNKKEAAAS